MIEIETVKEKIKDFNKFRVKTFRNMERSRQRIDNDYKLLSGCFVDSSVSHGKVNRIHTALICVSIFIIVIGIFLCLYMLTNSFPFVVDKTKETITNNTRYVEQMSEAIRLLCEQGDTCPLPKTIVIQMNMSNKPCFVLQNENGTQKLYCHQ